MKPTKILRMKFEKHSYGLSVEGSDFVIQAKHFQGVIEVEARLVLPDRVGAKPGYVFTDRQLNRATSRRGLTWEGSVEGTLVARDRQGVPICELRRVQ